MEVRFKYIVPGFWSFVNIKIGQRKSNFSEEQIYAYYVTVMDGYDDARPAIGYHSEIVRGKKEWNRLFNARNNKEKSIN